MDTSPEDWLDHRLDADDQTWTPRKVPLLMLSRTRAQVFIGTWPVWSLTLFIAAFGAASIVLNVLEFLAQFGTKWFGSVFTHFFMFLCTVLSAVTYRSIRFRTAIYERALTNRCLCCAHDLAATLDEEPGFRRCPECGHIWAWPFPSTGPLTL